MPDACRMSSLDLALYSCVNRTKLQWKRLWNQLQDDSRLATMERSERRKLKLVFPALYRLRNFATGLLDADLGRIADAADYGITATREALMLLWEMGYLEVIPRKVFDPKAKPKGWKGRGKYLQATNAYEVKDPEEPPRWPCYAPVSDTEFGIRVPSKPISNTYLMQPVDKPQYQSLEELERAIEEGLREASGAVYPSQQGGQGRTYETSPYPPSLG